MSLRNEPHMTIIRLSDWLHRIKVPASEMEERVLARTAEILILPCVRRERLEFDGARAAGVGEASICA